MAEKTYKNFELLEVVVETGGQKYALAVIAFRKKRVVTSQGSFRYADIQGWRLPWGNTFKPNLHMVLPLCNRGSQRIW